MQWVRMLPADALRKAGSLQKAHQPPLESMLAAQAASGKCVCPVEKGCQQSTHLLHACYVQYAAFMWCMSPKLFPRTARHPATQCCLNPFSSTLSALTS